MTEPDPVKRERAISAALTVLARPRSGWVSDQVFLDRLRSTSAQAGRILLVAFGQIPANLPLLSVLIDQLDIAHLDRGVLVLSSFSGGELRSQRTRAFYNGESSLIVGDLSLFLREVAEGSGRPDAIMFVSPEQSLEVAQEVADVLALPYFVAVRSAEYRYSMLRFLNSAAGVFLASPDLRREWAKSHVVPASPLDVDDPVLMARTIAGTISGREMSRSGMDAPSTGAHRVLLVSYFAPPATPVSVNRLGYWKDKLPELASERGRELSVTWLTATWSATGRSQMAVVPDLGPLRLPPSAYQAVRKLRSMGVDDLGASWTEHVRQAIEKSLHGYDTVVFSGNPFHYFDLAETVRREWSAKVILDFRDPFAWNPRFRYTIDQRSYLMEVERQMVEKADAVVSVNDQCLSQISPDVEVERVVVANGFDEEVVEQVRREALPQARMDSPLFRIVYSGTVFANLPIDQVLDALPSHQVQLVHFGRDYSKSRAVSSHPAGESAGLVSYQSLVAELVKADAGLIMTSGESSTQTSKLFDYIACDLDIIIVTDGEPKTGNLHQITKDLDRVMWVRNNPSDLATFFESYQPGKVKRPQRMKFSRRFQATSLLDLILELERA